MTRHGVLGWLVVLLAASQLPSTLQARPGVVKTVDGQTYEGEVDDKDPASVLITIRGIQTRIERGKVASISYPQDKVQELSTRLAKLDPKDAAGHLQLARDAMNAQQYTIARDALERARVAEPNNADVVALLDIVQSQVRMERAKQRPAAEGPRASPAATAVSATTTRQSDQKLLRPAEINAIRQAELRADDSNVRVRFEHNVLRRYADYRGRERIGDFFALNPVQQAQQILGDRDAPAELKQDVIIQSDPPSLLAYRRSIQPFVVQNCATGACHATGSTTSTFQLVTPADSDAATYTNFYLLSKYTQPLDQPTDTVFGKGAPRMIDRQRPEQSLLLQYSMPGSMVELHHPDVQNYRPPLRGVNDPRYALARNWIGSVLQPVDPEYPFDPQPAVEPSTQPASQPAVAPATRPASGGRPATRPAAPQRPAPRS